jgi:hypothetical protein
LGGIAPLNNKQTKYIPTVNKLSYRWGLECRLIETSGFTNFILPKANELDAAVTDSLNYHLDTARGTTTLVSLLSSLTTAGVDVNQPQVRRR